MAKVKTKKLVLGIMSGTSMGDVDYALCDVTGARVRLVKIWTVKYPPELEKKLQAAARGSLGSWEFCQLHHDLGRFYARHALQGGGNVRLVGLHGQTVFHNPDPRGPATFQLGEPAYLSEALRVPVINNFRAADIAAGGQGAPLATMFHKVVFGKSGRHICVNNLGGISNVTSLDFRGRERILAFDTGPANMLIDFAVRHFSNGRLTFDREGAWARKGRPADSWVARWLKHPFFSQKPPKSTGREMFGEPFFNEALKQARELSQYDLVSSFTALTARSIALNYKLHLKSWPDRVILTGGGASNPALVEMIRSALAEMAPRGRRCEVVTSDTLEWPVQAIEPAAFALLADLRMRGRPGNIRETTGAGRQVLCGHVSG